MPSRRGMQGALWERMTDMYELGACPACGGEAAEEVASADDMRAEVETLWEFHTRRLRPDTPHAHLTDRLVFSQRAPLRIARCTSCGTLYRNPREQERALGEIYEDEQLSTAAMDRLFASQRDTSLVQAERLTRIAGGTGRGLEVGSYIGGFLAAAQKQGWQFSGVDVNEGAVAYACARGLDARVGTIESVEQDAETYDAIAIWNCLDQLPRPREAIRSAYRLLRPGGILAVRVPNGGFYQRTRRWLNGPAATLAEASLAYNNLLGFPYRTGFTPASLQDVLRKEGFDIVTVRGDTLVPLADEWTKGAAVWEERTVKGALLMLTGRRMAPWFEVYGRK